MSIGLTYKDSVQLIKPVMDTAGYGSERIGQIETVSALFIENTGVTHGANQEAITSDAEIYIDPTHWFVEANVYRLEGFLIIANPFGGDNDEAWYKVVSVSVGQDKLLGNTIDNVLLRLKKTTEIPYVS